jgi:hypothetical protein
MNPIPSSRLDLARLVPAFLAAPSQAVDNPAEAESVKRSGPAGTSP